MSRDEPPPLDRIRLGNHPVVGHVEYQKSMGSTSDVALKLAAGSDAAMPALVLTERQTAGRGRGSHRWWAGPGALTFSLVIEPARWDIADWQLPQLSLTTAVAVCDVLSNLCPAETWQIKWPNDVVIGGRKICGILIEVPNVKPKRAVLGVGLNVNNSWQHAPAELHETGLRSTGTALCDVAGYAWDRTDVLHQLLTALEGRLEQLGRFRVELPAMWRWRCALDGRRVQVDTGSIDAESINAGSNRVSGICVGIDNRGMLLVETPERRHRLASGTLVSVE